LCNGCQHVVAFVQQHGPLSAGGATPAAATVEEDRAAPPLPASWMAADAVLGVIEGARFLPVPGALIRCGVKGGVRADANYGPAWEAALAPRTALPAVLSTQDAARAGGAVLFAAVACAGCCGGAGAAATSVRDELLAIHTWTTAFAAAVVPMWECWTSSDTMEAWAAVQVWWVDQSRVAVEPMTAAETAALVQARSSLARALRLPELAEPAAKRARS